MILFFTAFIFSTTSVLALNGLTWLMLAVFALLLSTLYHKALTPILLGGIFGLLCAGQAQHVLESYQLPKSAWQKPMAITVDIESVIYDKPQVQSVVARILGDHTKPFPIKIKLNRYHPQRFMPGDRCTLVASLKPIRGYMNPGGKDFVGPALVKGLTAQGYVLTNRDIRCEIHDPIKRNVYQYRKKVNNFIQREVQDPAIRQLLSALAVGSKTLDDQTKIVLQKTGTSHLLAISGLHVGLVAMLIFWLTKPIARLCVVLKWVDSSRMISLLIALLAVFLYIQITGSAISSQRAGWMFLMGVMLFLFFHGRSTVALLLSVMFLMISLNPFVVLDIGFWLSCGMVFILLMISAFVVGPQRGIVQNIQTQWRLSCASLPFTLLMINQSSWISPLANIIAIPVVSFVIVPLLLIFDAVILGWPMLAKICLGLASLVSEWLWAFLSWMSEWSVLVELPFQSPQVITCLCLAMFCLILPRGLWGKSLGIYFLMLVFLDSPDKPEFNDVWVTWLDVGQGLSTVVQTQHHTLIYDTGPQFEDFEAATFTLVPFLKYAGVRTIDLLIVSHADNDHRGGVARVLESFDVKSIIVGQVLPDIPRIQRLCDLNRTWTWDGVLFEQIAVRGNWKGSNNYSCVLKITARDQSILLLGDLEKDGEAVLLNSGHSLKSQIISAPHHGSNTSSTQALLDVVQPDYAIFSTGFLNRYHHPHPTVVKRYDALGVKRLDTAAVGAICMRSNRDEVKPCEEVTQ